MKQKFLKFCTSVKDKVVNASRRAKLMFSGAVATVLAPVKALAQELAGTGYDAGTNALEEVASELVKYVPYVVNLCYALAGIVAIVGAISVYIAMNRIVSSPSLPPSSTNQRIFPIVNIATHTASLALPSCEYRG